MKFTVALALLSVAHAWPLFGRTGNYEDRPSDTSISGKQASCPAGAVRIRSEQSGLCLSPQVDDKSGNEKHRRNNDGSSRDSSYGASKDDGKQYREGVKVVTADCKDAAAWFLPDHDDKKGGDRVIDAKDVSGPIVLADHPELALDAGRKPADGGPLSLYKLNSSPQQDFTFKDGQLQAKNSQCIDIGRSSELQTWTCDKENANNNQRFEIVECKVQQETQSAQPTTVHKTKTETKVQEKPTTVYKTKTETKVVPTTVVKTETKTETKVEQQAPVTVTPAPVTQTKYETRYKTETRTKNNTLTETKTQTKTEQKAPVTVTPAPITQTRTETKYVTKTNDVTSIKPITETNNVTSTKPVTQTKVVTSTKPVTETKVATKVETTTVEKPITKIEQVKEYRTETKYETKTVTEEAKPKETGQAEQGQGQHQDKEYGQHGQQGQDHGKDHGQHGQQGQDHGKDHEQHGQHEHGKEQGKGENQH